jgi:hypothetical protein
LVIYYERRILKKAKYVLGSVVDPVSGALLIPGFGILNGEISRARILYLKTWKQFFGEKN